MLTVVVHAAEGRAGPGPGPWAGLGRGPGPGPRAGPGAWVSVTLASHFGPMASTAPSWTPCQRRTSCRSSGRASCRPVRSWVAFPVREPRQTLAPLPPARDGDRSACGSGLVENCARPASVAAFVVVVAFVVVCGRLPWGSPSVGSGVSKLAYRQPSTKLK